MDDEDYEADWESLIKCAEEYWAREEAETETEGSTLQ